MKKIIVGALSAGALLVGAVACDQQVDGSGPTVESAAEVAQLTVEPKPTQKQLTTRQKDTMFTTYLAEQNLPLVSEAPAEAISVAHSMCEALSNGVSFEDLLDILVQEFTPYQAGIFVGASVATYCPENESKLP